MDQWYHGKAGVQRGPFTLEQMREQVLSGEIGPDDLAWCADMAEWTAVRDVAELRVSAAAPAPPPLGAPVPPPLGAPGASPSSLDVVAGPVLPAEELVRRPTAITLLAAYEIITGLFFLVGTAALLLAGPAVGDEEVAAVLTVLSIPFGILGLMKVVAGIGLLQLSPLGRILAIVLAVLSLPWIPLGTALGACVLLLLFQPAVSLLFRRPSAASLTREQAGVLRRFRESPAWSVVMGVALGLTIVGSVPMSGIVAAIAIPNFLNAMQRGKQKRTMGDMRTLATAVEAYSVDHQAFPRTKDAAGLQEVLAPTYILKCPLQDAWTNDFAYAASADGTSYTIVSFGKDGLPGNPSLGTEALPGGATTNFNDDIVFATGSFVQYPEGVQD